MADKLSTSEKLLTSLDTDGDSSNPFSGIETGTTTAAEILSSLDSNSTSILDSYDNVTYHFKFSYTYGSEEIIIAETAKTDVYITDCEIESYIGQDFRVKNISPCNMTIHMRESHGTTLFDKLMFIQNKYSLDYKTCVYGIELSFYGYDQNGSGKIKIGGTYQYSVIMSDLQFKIDLFGSLYTLTFTATSNTAFNDDYGIIPDGGSIDVQTSGRLGDILSSLQEYLNQNVIVENYGLPLVNYNFNYIPYNILQSETGITIPISASSPADLIVTNNFASDENTNSTINYDVVQYPKGVQISKFIDGLLANSPDVASLLLNKGSVTNADLISDNDTTYSVTHKVIASVVQGTFIPSFNRYMTTITYTIIPKLSVNAIQSTKQVNNTNNNFDTWSAKKFNNLSKFGILNKKYDYIFTGKNTNVFDLDISGNMYYALEFPMLDGAISTSSAITTGMNISPEMIKDWNESGSLSSATNNLQAYGTTLTENGLNPLGTNNFVSSNPFGSALSNTALSQTTEEQLTDTAPYVSTSNLDTSNLSTDAINQIDSSYPLEAVTSKLSQSTKSEISNVSYIDDIYSPITTANLYVPINMTAQQNPYSYNGFSTDNANGMTTIFSTIMNQVYGSGSNCLQKLDMKIRLDPYWLGCSLSETNSGGNIDLTYSSASDYRPYDISDQCLILTYNVPVYPSDSNQVTLNRNDMISGVYQIYKVTSIFGNGEMTQRLEGTKLVMSPLSSILKIDGVSDV